MPPNDPFNAVLGAKGGRVGLVNARWGHMKKRGKREIKPTRTWGCAALLHGSSYEK